MYHEKLGTIGQRVTRLRQLSVVVAQAMGLSAREIDLTDRTAYLCKADLVTRMVYDFPELQGTMGGYYAESSGEVPEVCQGIREHYKPTHTGDDFPSSRIGIAVSIADKLDAIVGAFGIGIQPTGSQDPYALRRQALGVVGMLMQEEKNLSLSFLLQAAYQNFVDQGVKLAGYSEIKPLLEEFFQQRIRFLLQEKGFRYDIVDAVLAQGGEKPYSTLQQARVLAQSREEEQFTAYTNAYVRCVNLSKKADGADWQPADLQDSTEKELAEMLEAKTPLIRAAVDATDYSRAYALAGELVPLIEKLFDSVMIMVEDKKLRQARLGLLQKCVQALGCLGDLTLLA